MSVTFLTNKDKEIIDQSIDRLSEEIGDFVGGRTELSRRFVTANIAAGVAVTVKTESNKVMQTGKNLFNVGRSAADYVKADGFKSVNPDTQQITIEMMQYSEGKCLRNTPIPVSVGDTLSISFFCDSHNTSDNNQIANAIVKFMDAQGNLITSELEKWSYVDSYKAHLYNGRGDRTFTIASEEIAFIMPGFRLNSSGEIANGEAVTMRVQLEFGDAATEWEAGTLIETPVNTMAMVNAIDGLNQFFTPDGANVDVSWQISYIVRTVNGKTGIVELTAEDVGAMSAEAGDELRNHVANNVKPTLTDAQKTACETFAGLFADTTGYVDSFLFFTDQHLCGASTLYSNFYKYMNQIEAVYNNTPTSMCVSGGDWLNDSNKKDNAAFMLGVIDGAMKERFGKYVLIVGNHDTNYQGYEYMESGKDGTYDRETLELCQLSISNMRNLWHREQGVSYFKVNCDSAVYYVFDTQLDWYPQMDEYRWEQIDWYANSLLTDKPERSAILAHIVDNNDASTPFIEAVTQVANAYNSKTSITLNGKTYNFASVSGKVGFVLGGHNHADKHYTVNGIPIITTVNLQVAAGIPSFDLVMVDWGAGNVNFVRVGSGENRTIPMA